MCTSVFLSFDVRINDDIFLTIINNIDIIIILLYVLKRTEKKKKVAQNKVCLCMILRGNAYT